MTEPGPHPPAAETGGLAFERVEATPDTTLLRLAALCPELADTEVSILIIDDGRRRHRLKPILQPAPPAGRLRAAYRASPAWLDGGSRFALELADGSLIDLPAPTPRLVRGPPKRRLSAVIEPTGDPITGVDRRSGSRDRTGRGVRGLLSSAGGTATLQAFSNGIGFAVSVLLARALGRDGFGVYTLALAWAGLLAIPGIVGFDRFLVRGMAVYHVRRQWPEMKGLLRKTNEIVLVASLTVGALATIVAALLLSSSERVPFAIAMLLVPLTNLTLIRQSAMQALGRVVPGQVPEYLIRPLLIIAGVGGLRLLHPRSLNATAAVSINIAAVGVAFVIGALWLHRVLPRSVRAAQAVYQTRDWISAGLPMMLIGGIWTANNYAAILIVGALRGPRAAAVFAVVDKGAALIALVLFASNMSLAPVIARLHATGDRAALERVTVRMARAGLAASIPVAALFALFPMTYLHLFGHGFGTGASALTILALGQLVNAAAGPAGNVLMMTGHERVAIRGLLTGLIANLLLGLILVPPLGVTGAAIGATASLILWNLILIILARDRVGINASAIGPRMVRRRS